MAAVYATLSDGEEIYNNAERNKENDPITLDDSIDLTSSSSANHHQNKRKINQISSTPRSRRKRQKLDENPESIEILDSPNIHHQAIPVENIQSGSTGIQSNNSSQNSFRPTRHLIRTTPFEQIINSPEIQNLANSIPANIYNNLPIIASNGISIEGYPNF